VLFVADHAVPPRSGDGDFDLVCSRLENAGIQFHAIRRAPEVGDGFAVDCDFGNAMDGSQISGKSEMGNLEFEILRNMSPCPRNISRLGQGA